MKIYFDDILTGVSLVFGLCLAFVPLAAILWIIYKVAAGAYHLLDKLIDKI